MLISLLQINLLLVSILLICILQHFYRVDTAISSDSIKLVKIDRHSLTLWPGVFATLGKPAARRWIF
jgi:hypothetical protein